MYRYLIDFSALSAKFILRKIKNYICLKLLKKKKAPLRSFLHS